MLTALWIHSLKRVFNFQQQSNQSRPRLALLSACLLCLWVNSWQLAPAGSEPPTPVPVRHTGVPLPAEQLLASWEGA